MAIHYEIVLIRLKLRDQLGKAVNVLAEYRTARHPHPTEGIADEQAFVGIINIDQTSGCMPLGLQNANSFTAKIECVTRIQRMVAIDRVVLCLFAAAYGSEEYYEP